MSYLVYRLYDEHDKLLYIGSTFRLDYRLREHREKWWAYAIKRVETEPYESLESARDAERMAIANERPIYNTRFNGVDVDHCGWKGTSHYPSGKLPSTWNMTPDEAKDTHYKRINGR